MYEHMTREDLIEQLHTADREIVRLTDANRRLADDIEEAAQDRDHWRGMCDELENKAANEAYRQRRAEERRLTEWNDWARSVLA